jgi:hypothetical protein
MLSRRMYRKPVPQDPHRYLRPGAEKDMATDLLHSDREPADRQASSR